jgi:NAD(P)-dependent dehydrogenase (short-subunit alcohol dehydrogenase family)
MKIDLSGQTAVITGGSAGIGLACAKLFLEAGANVAICSRDKEKLSNSAKQLETLFPSNQIISYRCDVLDKDQVEAFATTVQEQFGGADILINNAGQARLSTFSDTSDDDWREELELKFFSIIYTSQVFLPQLERSDAAAIVCTGSLLSRQPEPHLVATSSARAGQLALIHGMAREFAEKRIRVNTVIIGQVESSQWRERYEALEDKNLSWEAYTEGIAKKAGVPLRRMGKPEEAAMAIFFLATPMSSFTTGSTVDVSGGLSRHVG